MDIRAYFRAVVEQNAEALRRFFQPDAEIRWHNTNELFTVEEYIQANCQYPGQWEGELERVEPLASGSLATAAHVHAREGGPSFHVASFIRLEEGKIAALDEYWGDDGPAPQWRRDKHIGRPIREEN